MNVCCGLATKSCPTLCDPMDCRLPLSTDFPERILEWNAITSGRRKWQSTPVFLPREFRRQRSLVGCCPWGRTEPDTNEVT